MVGTVEVSILYLFLILAAASADDFGDGVFQALDGGDHILQVLLIAVAAATDVVQHHAGIAAHLHAFAAEGNDTGYAGGDAVYIDGDIAPALADGVEDGDAGVNVTADGVDTDIQVLIARV